MSWFFKRRLSAAATTKNTNDGKAVSLGSISKDQRLFTQNEEFRTFQIVRKDTLKSFVQQWLETCGNIRVKQTGCEPSLMDGCFCLTIEYLTPEAEKPFIKALQKSFPDVKSRYDPSLLTHVIALPFQDPEPQSIDIMLVLLIVGALFMLFSILGLLNPQTYGSFLF